MKRILLLLLVLALPALAKENTLIVPGKSVGPITASSTRADLIRPFGAANLKEGMLSEAEGQEVAGSILFPKDERRRLEIIWSKTKRIASLKFYGQRSVWHTAQGITLGTTLAELEKLNGKPFKFSGFGWDYGGQIVDWQGGKLQSALKDVWPTLDPGAQDNSTEFSGDREFLSSKALEKKLHIRVVQLRVQLNSE
ncbi:MAG: hypothetical protein U0931_35525 [Vulcanimicrobiota bacterium]